MDWRSTQVAPDHSHHTVDGRPLYAARFHEVLQYHAPGLASARDDSGAMHIDLTGRPVYAQRFVRTFGFYEGLAAVHAEDGWMHIRPDGSPLTARRFEWCGNYQGGRCTVREPSGRYRHLDANGDDVYPLSWRYAGDYREGIAVVQGDDGQHSHIDWDGSLLHGHWFIDLDVYHKGFARARDEAGWTHVDAGGKPLYERRFASVEPFYNGQARVERFDGGLEVVDESGATRIELRPARQNAFASLSGDLVGFWRTRTIATAVELGIIERLPGTGEDVARRLDLDANRLGALLRGLRELGLVRRADATWFLTPRGALLRRDHPLTLADAAIEYAGPLSERWAALPEALRDAEWSDPNLFSQVAADPGRVGPHHRMLRSYARHDYPVVAEALPVSGDEVLLDAGGGVGVLAERLAERHPGVQVKVLERPEVAAMVPDHPRVEPVEADLFGPWPAEGDAAILARVLHDWDDERAVHILERAREALVPGGRVYVVDLLIADDGAFGGLCDLHLLMATGGRERTREAYQQLLDRAGIDLVQVIPLATPPSILVGVVR